MTSTEFRSVVDRYLGGGSVSPAPSAPPRTPPPTSTLDIAVVGMAGRFPGAGDIRQFWDNLAEGRKCVGELPEEILGEEPNGYRWGGVIADRDCFDAAFFGIDPREADSMNLHQRLLLQEAWHALEDAGIDPESLTGSDTGMFVGSEPAGYLHQSFTGASDALVATRLSYLLDWHGPALVVNTACSSSVVAIHLACQSLRNEECGIALAAGTNAGLSQDPLDLLGDMGVLSPTGECRTFDNSANGTVFSEGVAVLVLKRLADAEADGDDIRGVIRATGVNHDGASNGITAPNGLAQERLIDAVYRRHGIDASRIAYVEAHGTGTALGDPVEANALVRAFGRLGTNPSGCVLGSAKAHIGHTGAAAGVIGVVKVLLSMRHDRYPGLPTFRTLNPMIKLDGSGFTVDAVGRPWPATPGVPRMAAVNSLGHSGTNAHLVVEEYLPEPRPEAPLTGPVAVPLSARDGERLRVLAGELAEYLHRVSSGGENGEDSERDVLRRLIADLLGMSVTELRGDRTLESQGAEPHQLARLAILLSRQTGGQVTVDTLYEAPSVDSLIDALAPETPDSAQRPHRTPPSLADVARTLQHGRAALAERAVVLAGSMPELIAALRALAAGTPSAGTVTGTTATPPTAPTTTSLTDLATAWCHGANIDWPDRGGRRVSLPGYPFAPIRHGKDRLAPRATKQRAVAAPQAAPVAVPAADPVPPVPAQVAEVPPVAVVTEQHAAGSSLREEIGSWLADVIATEIGVAASAIDRWERFDAFGVDSVVRTRVNRQLAEHFPSASRTLLFEFATVDEVADLLATDFPSDCRAALRATSPAATHAPEPPALGEPHAPVASASVVSPAEVVAGWLSGVVADEAGLDASGVDVWGSWAEFGIDSVVRTRVNHRIAEAFPEASRTLLFEFSSVGEVAESLAADFPDRALTLPGGADPVQEPPASVVSPAEVVAGWLSGVVADEAGLDASGVDVWGSWAEFGIDSVVRTRVNHRIAEAFPEASRTLLFEFSSVGEVAESLAADFPDRARALPGQNATTPATAEIPEWPAHPTWTAPFPARETGFSASRVLLDPAADPDDTDLVRECQATLLDTLLRGEDLDRVGGLIDLHAVSGAAGLRLAARHRRLHVHLRAADPAQAEQILRAAKEHGLDTQVTVAHSEAEPVRQPCEVAVGIEGSHLMTDKAGYLAGIASALPEGGRLLLADFLAVGHAMSDPALGLALPTPEQWADALADAGFVLDDAVDASAEAGHFLADFDVDQNTAALDPVAKGRWRFLTDLAVPLERGGAAYLLLRLRKDSTAGQRRAGNRARIASATPYSEAVTSR
ncbi:beta-ketoacyl synthase N-terminal-like domain-containing protein [Saccharomonospora xinjiangensis]|uniref:beta-ketoacyl synthase N-terminal-like domain-containing protein n=1 Tax=Saccharomonospora xinjiangensis TaxID=75294 RepID=UPI00106F9048|nr:beta-ketoacyl synthase N-terminal-like domain-containing protein [Saccharomonospora xinjiangensis]QBQ60374.1 Polyketide synthase PksJ [Saccharomonospora xinjiangensis]